MEYKNIIISGGSSKAISLIGAIKCLEKYNILHHIDNFVGCSSGNLPILFMILNVDICKSYIFSLYIYKTLFQKDNIIDNLVNRNGLFQGKEFITILDNFMYKETDIKYITLKELFLKTKKNYTIITTDLSNFKIVHFNHKTHPNLQVSEAIKASCSLPILFCPSTFLEVSFTKYNYNKYRTKYNYYASRTSVSYIGFKNEKLIFTRDRDSLNKILVFIYFTHKWIIVNTSLSPDITINGNVFIQKSILLKEKDTIHFFNKYTLTIRKEIMYSDGGILDNYPIYLSNNFKTPTIGFYYKTSNKKIKKKDNSNILFMVRNIISGIYNEFENFKIKDFTENTVVINIPKKINIMDLNLNLNDAKLLIIIGYKSTKDFILNKKKQLATNVL